MYSSKIQPYHISDPSGSIELHLSPIPFPPHNIQVSNCVSQIKPSPLSGLEMCASPPSSWSLTSVQAHWLVSPLHTSPISFPIKTLRMALTQVIYQLQPGHEMYIWHPSMSTLTSIKVYILASHLHSSSISLAFRSYLNLIQVTIIASQLHLGANIPPSSFWGVSTPRGPLYILLTSIQVESHTRPNPNKCVSSPTRSPLLHIRINSGLKRRPSGYQDVHLTCSCPTESISKYHHLTYTHVRISTSCRSIALHLTPTQVASQLHTDTVSNPTRFQNLHHQHPIPVLP